MKTQGRFVKLILIFLSIKFGEIETLVLVADLVIIDGVKIAEDDRRTKNGDHNL